jgi:hypothetical protein
MRGSNDSNHNLWLASCLYHKNSINQIQKYRKYSIDDIGCFSALFRRIRLDYSFG